MDFSLMFICRASGILGADDPFGDVCNSVFFTLRLPFANNQTRVAQRQINLTRDYRQL